MKIILLPLLLCQLLGLVRGNGGWTDGWVNTFSQGGLYIVSTMEKAEEATEYYMIELLRPRYPPPTAYDAIIGNFDNFNYAASDKMYEETKFILDYIVNNAIGTSMSFLESASPLPEPINAHAFTVIRFFTAVPLKVLLKSVAIRKVYPRIGPFLVKMAADRGLEYFCPSVITRFNDSFLRFKRGHLVALMVGVTQECTSPEVLLQLLKEYGKKLPSDIPEDLFTKIAKFQRFDRFLGYFRALLKVRYSDLKNVEPQINERVLYKMTFWDLKELYLIFNEKYKNLKTDLDRIQSTTKLSLRRNIRVVDWYLGGSKFFISAVMDQDNDSAKAAKWLCSNLMKGDGWRILVDTNSFNLAWILGTFDLLSIGNEGLEYAAKTGTPAILASFLSFNCLKDTGLENGIENSRFPELSAMQKDGTTRIKKGIIRLLPEMRRIASEYTSMSMNACGSFGQPKQNIIVNIDWVMDEFPHQEDIYELILAFLEVSLLLPRSVLISPEVLPKMTTFTEWTNAALISYCAAKKERPSVEFVPKERLPDPKWYLRNYDRSNLENRTFL
jgi:hypothetical protein